MSFEVLFVSGANVCRGPAAQAILDHMLEEADLADVVSVDSAGIAKWAIGEPPNADIVNAGADRGYEIHGEARQFNPEWDFPNFDYIVAMDEENYRDIVEQDPEGEYSDNIHMLTDFCIEEDAEEVPDPLADDDDADFESVLDILEDACHGLLERLATDLHLGEDDEE